MLLKAARLLLRVRIELLAIVLLGVVALTAGMREAPLVDWDEATYAQVAHEAVGSGNCLHFTWNGDPYVKKPPLLFWMVIASFKTFGESAWAARLPSIAAGIGTLLVLYFSAAGIAGRLAGLLAGLLPLGFYFFIARGGRECATDGPLIFFSALAIGALIRSPTHRRWLPVVGLASGLAILSKGLAGVLPLVVTALAVLLVPGFETIGIAGLALVAGLTTVVIAPWLSYELICNRALFWEVFVEQETLFRVTTHLEVQRQAAAATLPTFLREVRYLWPVLLPLGGLVAGATRRGARASLLRIPPGVLVWLLWLVLGLAAACAVQTKLGWYILPALPPTALLCGAIIGTAFRNSAISRAYTPALATLALIIIAVEMPGHWRRIDQAFRGERERSRPSYVLGVRARTLATARDDKELFFVGVELPTMVYYSEMRSHFVTLPSADFPDLAYHQLVVREADGALLTVGNLDDEWNLSGPAEERGAVDAGGGLCWSAGAHEPSHDLRLSLLDGAL